MDKYVIVIVNGKYKVGYPLDSFQGFFTEYANCIQVKVVDHATYLEYERTKYA